MPKTLGELENKYFGEKDSKERDQYELDQAKELIDSFLKSEENKERARIIAQQIYDHVGKNWITINEVCKVFKIDQKDCVVKLETLKMFDLCVSKEYKENKVKYKIIFNKESLKKILEEEIVLLKVRLNSLQVKYDNL